MDGLVRPVFDVLRDRLAAAFIDAEYERLAPGLEATVRFVVGERQAQVSIAQGALRWDEAVDEADVVIQASEEAWASLLASPPPPTFHAFTALALANPAFTIKGNPQDVAQARPTLERLIERVVASPPAEAIKVTRRIEAITGRYHTVRVGGVAHEIYAEEAGEGMPVVFLHTAGADSRQFHGQLSDTGLAAGARMIAFDLPFHGRSFPPRDWQGGAYRLHLATYRDWCVAFLEQVVREPAVIVGGSMGAAMALVLAAERPDLLRGIVAVEPPFQARGRRNPYQNHVGVHGALHNAAFVRGLMSPLSPLEDRRRAAWVYSQGAPGIYPGDLAFYSDEFDGAVIAPRIDAARTPVALLCGSYDYSASPEDGRRLHELIPKATLAVMPGLGHFPMIEHPDGFRPYLVEALRHASHGAIDVR